MSSIPADPGDPIWADHRNAAERWRDDWADRARRHPREARQGFVLTRSQCVLSEAEVRSRLRRRTLSAPRHGVLSVLHPGEDAMVAAALAACATAIVRPGSVISHESAAILLGIAVLNHPTVATLSAETGRGGHRSGVALHITALPAQDLTSWYGVAITSPARTVADLTRSGRIAGLVSADAALRADLITRAELIVAVGAASGWPGARAARWVAEHADGLSESALESLVRGRLLEAGLPAPELQVELPGTGARVDMLYRAERLVIEADGMTKYTKPETLRAEKRRAVRIERAGYRILRVLWEHAIGDASELIADVRAIRST